MSDAVGMLQILREISSDDKESNGVILLGISSEVGPTQFLGWPQLAAALGLNYSALFENKNKHFKWPQLKPQLGL